MLNRGYAYTTIITSKYCVDKPCSSHVASPYPHLTYSEAWQQKLNNGGSHSQRRHRHRKRIEDHFRPNALSGTVHPGSRRDSLSLPTKCCLKTPISLVVSKPSRGSPPSPAGGYLENTLLRLVQRANPQLYKPLSTAVGPSFHRHRHLRQNTAGRLYGLFSPTGTHPKFSKNLPGVGSKHCTSRCLRNPHTHRPRTAPRSSRFRVGCPATTGKPSKSLLAKVISRSF